MELFDRMLDLSGQGFYCAQILLILALESEGKEDPDLVRAMGGLTGGMGFSGRVCGALTGGCCLLGYFCGKGEAEELEDPNAYAMIRELVEWFEGTMGEAYGGSTCEQILDGDPGNKMRRCPQIVEGVFEKCLEILQRNGTI